MRRLFERLLRREFLVLREQLLVLREQLVLVRQQLVVLQQFLLTEAGNFDHGRVILLSIPSVQAMNVRGPGGRDLAGEAHIARV